MKKVTYYWPWIVSPQLLLSFLIAWVLPLPLSAQVSQSELADFDAYVEQARKQWKVPGLAISVVKDGEVVLSKGYGVRELGTDQAVTDETLFAMASTTKAVTATAMAMLVDEGKVAWSDRVIDHLPEFRLKDPYVTRELRVKDLFTHNAGLGNADVLWYGLKLDSEEIVRRMQYMEPSYSFRGGYRYQNLMYLVAGQLIERVSGLSWEDFVAQRIFSPLDMLRSFPTQALSSASANRAKAHYYIQGKMAPILDTDADMIGPAGSGWTCVSDMTKWMNFLLDSARVNGERLVSAENFIQLFRPQIVLPYESFYPSKHLTQPTWTTYALGWFQHDYNGRAVSFHTGSLAGTVAICGLIPKERLGVYIQGNLDHAEVRHALMYKVFDLFEGRGVRNEGRAGRGEGRGVSREERGERGEERGVRREERGERGEERGVRREGRGERREGSLGSGQSLDRDWSTEFLKLYGESKAPEWEPEAIEGEVNPPDVPLAEYTGVYTHELWGEVQISHEDDRLKVKYGGFVFDLRHYNNNTFWGLPRPWDWIEYVSFIQEEGKEPRVLFIGEEFRRE